MLMSLSLLQQYNIHTTVWDSWKEFFLFHLHSDNQWWFIISLRQNSWLNRGWVYWLDRIWDSWFDMWSDNWQDRRMDNTVMKTKIRPPTATNEINILFDGLFGLIRNGSRIFHRGGHQPFKGSQHTTLRNFPKTVWNLENFGPWWCTPWDPWWGQDMGGWDMGVGG